MFNQQSHKIRRKQIWQDIKMRALANSYTYPARYISTDFQADLLFITETHLETTQGKDVNLTQKIHSPLLSHTCNLFFSSASCFAGHPVVKTQSLNNCNKRGSDEFCGFTFLPGIVILPQQWERYEQFFKQLF